MEDVWYSYSRKVIPDFESELKSRTKEGTTILIGTDALRTGKALYFVTVVVFRIEGKGGNVLFKKEKITREHSLWEKLSIETWKSLDTAMKVDTLLGSSVPIEVHVDASNEIVNKSSDYVQQLVGMVVGQGFKCKIKPDSWVSTHCADHIVRNKHLPGKERRLLSKRKPRFKKNKPT